VYVVNYCDVPRTTLLRVHPSSLPTVRGRFKIFARMGPRLVI
jgi:hypothetical protein